MNSKIWDIDTESDKLVFVRSLYP